MIDLRLAVAAVLLLSASLCSGARAATFQFGANANGLEGVASAVLMDDGFSMTIQSGPSGALITERSQHGLGVDSAVIPGVTSPGTDVLNLIEGDPPLDGTPEFITISFDQPGFITYLDFDGVKDESLEYFILTTESGERYNFFDSAANTSVPGAVDDAVQMGVVTGDVVFLLEDPPLIDDEIGDLLIPFAAGELVTLTFAELGPAFGPTKNPNGARFQGITVSRIPEPSGLMLVALAMLAAARVGKRS